MLASFSGYIAADEVYDGPFCILSIVDNHTFIVIEGLLSGLERKTAEPIAREHGVHREPIQAFVGHGSWDDEAVMAELRSHVGAVLGDPEAALVLDPSVFAKKGTHSCGVDRQWCGRMRGPSVKDPILGCEG